MRCVRGGIFVDLLVGGLPVDLPVDFLVDLLDLLVSLV